MDQSTDAPPPGGHAFAAVLGGAVSPTPPARRSHRTRNAILLSVAVLAVGVTCAGVQWGANLGYDDALVAFDQTVADAAQSQSRLEDAAAALSDTRDAATAVVEGAPARGIHQQLGAGLGDRGGGIPRVGQRGGGILES